MWNDEWMRRGEGGQWEKRGQGVEEPSTLATCETDSRRLPEGRHELEARGSQTWRRRDDRAMGEEGAWRRGDERVAKGNGRITVVAMSTINAILTPSPDGTLHLPLPVEWRDQPIKVRAELEPVSAAAERGSAMVTPQPGSLKGFWMAPDFDEPLEDFKEYME